MSEYVPDAKRLRVGPSTPDFSRRALTRAHGFYDQLHHHRKLDYDVKALESSRLHSRRVQAEIDHADAALALFRTRLAHERQQHWVPNNMGECRFDD